MANPRDLAEQAFALLQNALSDSEARASDLDEQLKRKRQPKNRLEEQLDVLTHRLEKVDAERVEWEQKAGHLEEVAEAERVKVAALKKKLEIAEGGPEKLTKKEINFWKAKAESIDTEITEYKNRLAALRRELNERDEALARLEATKSAGAPVAAAAESATEIPDASLELRRQLEQRDRWLAELRLELHELKAEPTAPLETEAEIETLRARIRGLEQSLGTAANARAGIESDLARAQYELADRERALREASAAAERQLAAERERILRDTSAATERDRAMLAEREHRLVELSAEVEHLRNDLRTRSDQQRSESMRQAEQATQSERELEALRMRFEQERQDSAAARAELQGQVIEREREVEKQRQLLAANDTDFRELRAQLTQRETDLHEHRRLLADREQALADARRQVDAHGSELKERERELADRSEQLRSLAQRLADRDSENAASAVELEQARAAVAESSREVADLRAALESAHSELERIGVTFAQHEQELADIRATLAEREHELGEARAVAQANARELDHARAALTAHEREVTSLRDTLLASSRELDDLRADKRRLENAAAEVQSRLDGAASEVAAAREQIAGLEGELKEEREHAESLSELANERRDHMTKLQEQVEEAEERYAEASWKLSKSLHFQRIVKRRRGLVIKILDALRGKIKANTALKAGLDGLRNYKAAAEQNQQKLLQRVDQLKAELADAEDTIKAHQSGTAGKQELATAMARATALEERLNTQAELIQSLEADLKAARLAQKAAAGNAGGDDKHHELEQLRKELETKNQVLSKLQNDADEQQRKLSKLRGSESETVRLKALTEKDRSEIETLQREIAELRQAAAQGGGDADGKAKERDGSITRLMSTIKEHEATIKKLTESADSWKRKYNFLAADSPEAHKNGEK